MDVITLSIMKRMVKELAASLAELIEKVNKVETKYIDSTMDEPKEASILFVLK